MGSLVWGPEITEAYDTINAPVAQAEVVGPMVDFLAELVEGPVLELPIGTGRVALPLSARGIPVRGIELSPAMAERLSAKPGSGRRTGDHRRHDDCPGARDLYPRVPGGQHDHERHHPGRTARGLRQRRRSPGAGRVFVVSVIVPQLRRVPPGDTKPSSPSIPATSGSRPSTTSWGRSRGPITGSPRRDGWCVTRRPIATSGRLSST